MMFRNLISTLRRPKLGLAIIALLHLVSIGLFVNGFLLTRVHLPERSAPAPGGSTAAAGGAAANGTAAPYNRVVWMMIDALRYDFVVSDGRYSCADESICHQGHMPYLSKLSRQEASRTFMFVADAPTTTTQRLKSMATGGLPSFFDISNSFTAGAVAEDNLIHQLHSAGHKLAFLGDTTWQQLFPTHWAWSAPYPCFNVKDLHTVDDGVWGHLLPALRQAGSWDGLLVAHYLGVDHCGHTHGVASTHMAHKLRQMDDHVRQVVAATLEQAGPGGAFEHALLVVTGDHGQTLGGDHGGGSPEEVDSALVAVDLKALHSSQSAAAAGSAGAAAAGGMAAPAACRANCTCGVEGNQCSPDLLQMDLTPTLAAMLGVPIPFANMGKLSAELWQLTAGHMGGAGSGGGGGGGGNDKAAAGATAWEGSLLEALIANAKQVHTYLNTYAATAGTTFSRAALTGLNTLFAGLSDPTADAGVRLERCYAYLEAAASVAREQWTQFGEGSMALGLALFAASLGLQAAAAFGSSSSNTSAAASSSSSSEQRPADRPGAASGSQLAAAWRLSQGWQLVVRWRPGHRLLVPTFRGWLAAVVLMHGLGIFSFFYLLSEGRMVCGLVAAACAGLALATGRGSRAAGKGVKGVVMLGFMSLRSNAMMAVLGVAHHTGQGFWARLTVHDPQPKEDVARGLQDKLAALKGLATVLMARSRLDELPPVVLAVAPHSLLCTLPILALAMLTERLRRGSSSGGGGAGSSLHRLLRLAAFASTAAYLQLEDAGKRGLLPADLTLQQLLAYRLPGSSLARLLRPAVEAVLQPVLMAWPAGGGYGALLLAAPLRVLLPHTTYACCTVLAAVWLVQVVSRRLRGGAAATAAAQLVLAVLVQVSDGSTPRILLLALVELSAIAKLLAKRAELLAQLPPPSPNSCDGGGNGGGGGGGSSAAAGVAVEAAALAGLVQAQLFFVTGHLCEFAGLQYTAGFIGSDDFHLWRSAGLIALNTFGGMLLVSLAMPALFEHVQAAAAAAAAAAASSSSQALGAEAAAQPAHGKAGQGGKTAAPEAKVAIAAAAPDLPAGGSSWAQPLLVAGLVRSLTAVCAALSAAVQRRHLYAWALFAPKFAFEACFLLLADLALLLVAALH